MPKRKSTILNRGRFQAQGEGLEKSRSWADVNVPTKPQGHTYINELKAQLNHSELAARQTCFERAARWVNDAPSNGYVVVNQIKTSFQPYPPLKDIRVDGEIHCGSAFKD